LAGSPWWGRQCSGSGSTTSTRRPRRAWPCCRRTCGYYIAKASDAVYLLTLSQPGGASNNVVDVDQPTSLPPQPAKCRDEDLARKIALKESCDVVEVVEVPAAQVTKLCFGPRDIPVDRNGYRAARTLAQIALRRVDEERLPNSLPTTQEAPR
jgi:hypothetical protein